MKFWSASTDIFILSIIIGMKTKKHFDMILRIFLIFSVLMVAACAGGAPFRNNAPEFSSILEKDWQLIEIRQDGGDIFLDRTSLEADGMGDAFTLRIEEDRISGKALPNRYFGPYTRTGQAMRIEKIASTLMANIGRAASLSETDYFDYLWWVQSWDQNGDNLELHTASPEGQRAVLIFRPM
jgi:heat shock protein HslJ